MQYVRKTNYRYCIVCLVPDAFDPSSGFEIRYVLPLRMVRLPDLIFVTT